MQHLGTKSRPTTSGRPRSEEAKGQILEAAYKVLRKKVLQSVGSHEISSTAGVTRATSYRWRNSKEEILFDACFDHVKPTFAISGSGAGLARLREFSLRAIDLFSSIDGQVIARLVTGIHEDTTLRRMYLNKFVIPIRQIQRNIIQGVIRAGELKRTTDPELLMDALMACLFPMVAGPCPTGQELC